MPPVYVVKLKDGVSLPFAPAGIRIVAAVDNATLLLGSDLLISSGSEGRGRNPLDPHMTGEAADVSIANLTPGQILKLKGYLETALGPLFTVLYEVKDPPLDTSLKAVAFVNPNATGSHLHVQRKKNTTYPPAEALEA